MPQDFDKALDNLKNMLSTQEGKKDLESMLEAFTGSMGGDSDGDDSRQDEGESRQTQSQQMFGGVDMDTIIGMKRIMDQMNSGNSQSANLLGALRPYLSPVRSKHVDTAIQIVKLSKLPEVIRNIKN